MGQVQRTRTARPAARSLTARSRTPRPRGTLLARFLPALLCALCAFLVAPAPPVARAVGVPAAPAPAADRAAGPADGPHVFVPGPHVSGAEAAELPDVVEHTVRFPTPPAAPPGPGGTDGEPARGRVEGNPSRERAPPGLPYDPQAPRGPPATRHS